MGDHDQDSLYDLTINQMEAGQPDASNGNQVALKCLECIGWLVIVEVTMNNEHFGSMERFYLILNFLTVFELNPT